MTDAVRITSDGNVGIGTITPAFPLTVTKNGGTAAISIDSQNTSYQSTLYFTRAGVGKWELGMTSTNEDWYLYGADWVLYAKRSNGHVGIGTTSPDSLLHIASTSTSGTKLRIAQVTNDLYDASLSLCWGASGDSSALILKYNPNSALAYIDTTYQSDASATWGDLLFRSNLGGTQTERMRIKAFTGRVGIGTSAPGELLQVNGSICNPVDNSCIVAGNDKNVGFVKKAGFAAHITTNSTIPFSFSVLNQTALTSANISAGSLSIVATLSTGGVFSSTGGGTSDRRKKKNIEYITSNALPIIDELKPASFIFKEYEELYLILCL
jgi:hypothetical protein